MNTPDWVLDCSFGCWVGFLAVTIGIALVVLIIAFLREDQRRWAIRPPDDAPLNCWCGMPEHPPETRGVDLEDHRVSAGDARCPVCQDSFRQDADCDERLVSCRKCGTLHHLRCFEYFKQCAVFGCLFTKWNSHPVRLGNK